ncbi:TIGR02611 family protein [Rhodococcus sp. 077-4]|uniref:TIGR02611 family protein n=1 Tax=Rhodococcus sp. 077-4 TaxID=2789271 RepID=UPI0039F5887B
MDAEQGPADTVKKKHRRFRARIAENKSLDLAYRITVGVVGTVVLILGVLAIPYPGPGWLIVFAGLGILASEFEWAKRALRFVRKRYDAFMDWFSKQSIVIKALGVLFTTVVVLATLWLLGTFALVGGWFGLEWTWLESPI